MKQDSIESSEQQHINAESQCSPSAEGDASADATPAKPLAVVYMPEREFLLPYFQRELSDYMVVTAFDAVGESKPALAVMVSSTDIYNVKAGRELTEETSLLSSSPWREKEEAWAEWCARNSLAVTIVRCPEVIGTGMRGLAMRLARGIARGTLLHIRDNEGLISLIHATDVAALAIHPELQGHTVNLTDGTETAMYELIDALAYRLGDKHVLTIKWPRIARAIYGSEFYDDMTRQLTFSNSLAMCLLGPSVRLNKVTEYLRTHNYNEESL